MAGIEKICEFSGEYPAHAMYGYKLNQLQIMPKYRKNFRGAKAKIYISLQGMRWFYKWGSSMQYHSDEMKNYEPPFNSEKEFIQYKKDVENLRLCKEYHFVLVTDDPELQGEVEGKYYNWTTDLSATKRKLKRLLRCKKLDIEFVEEDVYTLFD